MMGQQLGRLECHELRDVWPSEAADFTPWLARPENLDLLGQALGLRLELEAQERAVGPFRADVPCRDMDEEHWVLIENQLERTNHGHLGQLLTYASGLEAVTIIWIAAQFTEEHRSTLDWLNKITDDSVRFFGLEVELWRIGNSPAAPKFNIVAKPNNWSRAVAKAAHAIDETDLSELRISQREYWAALNKLLDEMGGPVAGNRKPQPQGWKVFPIGRKHFHLTAVASRPNRQIRVELHISGDSAKLLFERLKQDQRSIERQLGYALEWEELSEQKDSRISIYMNDIDPADPSGWPDQHRWLAERLNDLHRVFAPRLRAVDANKSAAQHILSAPQPTQLMVES